MWWETQWSPPPYCGRCTLSPPLPYIKGLFQQRAYKLTVKANCSGFPMLLLYGPWGHLLPGVYAYYMQCVRGAGPNPWLNWPHFQYSILHAVNCEGGGTTPWLWSPLLQLTAIYISSSQRKYATLHLDWSSLIRGQSMWPAFDLPIPGQFEQELESSWFGKPRSL